MEIDAREKALKSRTQLMTMAAPPSAARPMMRSVSPLRSSPSPAQMTSSVSAPNAQRQNTTSMIGWPDMITNQPIVPRIAMAADISIVPRTVSFMMDFSNPLRLHNLMRCGCFPSSGKGNMDRGPNYIRCPLRICEKSEMLDDLDRNLLEILVRDARTSLKDLAAQVGLSSPSVSERL